MIYLSLPNSMVNTQLAMNSDRQEGHHVSTEGSTERPKHTRHTCPSTPHDFNRHTTPWSCNSVARRDARAVKPSFRVRSYDPFRKEKKGGTER